MNEPGTARLDYSGKLLEHVRNTDQVDGNDGGGGCLDRRQSGGVDDLERGQALGQLRAAVEPAAIADALIGTVLFRTLIAGAQSVGASAVIRALIEP